MTYKPTVTPKDRYRVIRSVSVAVKDRVLCWEEGDTFTDAPAEAIKDWLKIGAIEEVA